MDNVFLLTRPDHEELVSYLAQWCRELIDLANREGIGVIDCAGKRANKKEVNGILAKQKLKLIMFNGHGNYNIICGQNNEPIIILGDNEQLLVGKITYARVCCAAKNVGAAIAKAGKGTFIGYVESFYIYTDSNFASRQTSDEIAALFLNPSNEVIRALLKGA